jgi:Flp pilus assembly protein TadB
VVVLVVEIRPLVVLAVLVAAVVPQTGRCREAREHRIRDMLAEAAQLMVVEVVVAPHPLVQPPVALLTPVVMEGLALITQSQVHL